MVFDPIVQVLAVVGLVILALMFLKAGPDLILMGGLTLLLVSGVVTPAKALEGFANEGLITVAVLFVVAEALRQTGAVQVVGNWLGNPRSVRSAQHRILWPSALLSAFMNNTPVVAMMMPVLSDWAKKYRMSVTYLFLPLSYAAILGGLCTLIGTSTTLVVNGLLIEEKGHGLGMFDLAWVGIPVMIAGLLFLVGCAKWLLPERVPTLTQLDDPREYTVEMVIEPASPLVGKTIEQAGLRHLPGVYLMEIDRKGHVLAAVSSEERLEAGDQLVFVGVVDSVVDLQRTFGLKPATDQVFKLDSPRSERCLIEAVVSNTFPFLRMTIRESRFRAHYNAAVVAVARNGQRVRKKIGDIKLEAGDTLLLEAHQSFLDVQRNSRDFFLVSQVQDSSPPRYERAWIARLILLAMVLIVAFGWLSMLQSALLAAGLMIMTRCCRAADARRSIDLSVLVTIAAGLGLGNAMKSSGAAEWLAHSLINAAGNHPWVVLSIIYLVTMLLTNIITAKAAAVLIFPIAMASATRLGVDYLPFAIVVMISAAASFATPIGYQTNLMVFGPGGYRFSDYLRLGGPLSLLVAVITIGLTPLIWPF